MTDDDQRSSAKRHPDLATTLEALKSMVDEGIAYTAIFYGLSGLTDEQAQQVKPTWESLPVAYRQKILQHMIDLSETDFEMDYRAIGLFSLDDASGEIRATAVDVLWEDESLDLMARLIDMSQWDDTPTARAAAASALGRYILLGELGDLPESKTIEAQDAVVNLWTNADEDSEVRRRALEAIANCSHEIVPEAIEEAYQSDDLAMQQSALFAMGRTCDTRWEEIVLREIESEHPEMRYEAARAAGELELIAAVPLLARLAAREDPEIQDIAIWSLGEIGSKEALRVLERLAERAYESGDELLAEALDDAIANASLMGGAIPLMFDMDEEPKPDDKPSE